MVKAPNGHKNIRDMLTIAGAIGYDRSAYQHALEADLRIFCDAKGGCDRAQRVSIQDFEDEFHASESSEWRLIYPAAGAASGSREHTSALDVHMENWLAHTQVKIN